MFLFRQIVRGRDQNVFYMTATRHARLLSQTSSSGNYCVYLVRQNDNENFLCTLLLPESYRRTAFAIRAFNIELAKIHDQVTESQIGSMRLKFWDDCIDKVYQGAPPKNPVALELSNAIKKHKLSKVYLKRLITARSKYLNASSFNTLDDMEAYADHTTSSVYFLLLEAAGYKNVQCDHAASHLGKAQGLSNLIRGLPHNIKTKALMLPQSLLMKHNISEETIFRGNFDLKFNDLIFDVASTANHHLAKARSLNSNLPAQSQIVFLPAVSVESYLKRLQKKNFDVFDAHLSYRNPFLPFSLFWNRWKSSY